MFGPKTAYMANFKPFSSYQSSFEDYYDIPDSNHYSYVIYPSEHFAVPEAHVANFESPANEGWYLDSGVTHHLTNNMANMNVREKFKGSYQLIIGNGQGLTITHIGDAYFSYKGSNIAYNHTHIALRDILLVPYITKNLLSISKLTADNNFFFEFVGNICYVKDSLKGKVLLQGLAEK